jgi:hypothetical protein
LTVALRNQEPPSDRDGLEAFLRTLKEALIVAKACRADMSASARRLNAAAGFQCGAANGAGPARWQNSGEPTGF